MNKYVIDLRPDCKVVQQICESDGKIILGTRSINFLEELNSDYINEHFGDLQDTAYQKGFEDGKAVNDKGCEGCKYSGTPQGDSPCYNCSNYYQNNWTAKSDKIEVGDEVTHKSDTQVWTAVCVQIDEDGRHMNLMGPTGSVGYYLVDDFKKTGRHFDIASILEAMKHD